MTSDQATLKDCPFCGNYAVVREHTGKTLITCNGCCAQVSLTHFTSTHAEALPIISDMWNSRVSPPETA